MSIFALTVVTVRVSFMISSYSSIPGVTFIHLPNDYVPSLEYLYLVN
jgi:hypothetical protein